MFFHTGMERPCHTRRTRLRGWERIENPPSHNKHQGPREATTRSGPAGKSSRRKGSTMSTCNNGQQLQPSAAVRCAVALNNLGCALLERSCKEQAHATFQDALQVVRRVVATELDEPPGQQIRDMHETLHRAELRLIGPVVAMSPEALRHKPLVYNASSPSLETVLPHLLNDSLYALRIDVSGADDVQQIPLDIVSTIILINFVNAGRRTAQNEGSTVDLTSRQPLAGVRIDRVLKVLGFANALAEHCDSDDGGGDSALFLVLVALDTTIQVHEEAGKAVEAEAMRARLVALKTHVETTLGFLFAQAVTAGAA
jgi:hypothetical protein